MRRKAGGIGRGCGFSPLPEGQPRAAKRVWVGRPCPTGAAYPNATAGGDEGDERWPRRRGRSPPRGRKRYETKLVRPSGRSGGGVRRAREAEPKGAGRGGRWRALAAVAMVTFDTPHPTD